MKILLSWIFDHINYSLSKVDVDKLVHLFNTRTAEIEGVEQVSVEFDQIYFVQAGSKKDFFCKELNASLDLPNRTDVASGFCYLVIKNSNSFAWAGFSDFGLDKEGLVPALSIDSKLLAGDWRKKLPKKDYILDVDNKSINHRPDLWGHYGIAREIAAFLDLELRDLSKSLNNTEIMHHDKKSDVKEATVVVELKDSDGCSRVAGWYNDQIQYKPSDFFIAIRLMLVGSKPINGMVDLTNYVMFDIGHPMHVFDAKAFANHKMIVRKAEKKETLQILDGQTITLRSDDIVIANDKKAVSLAGIMGGLDSGYSQDTKEIVLEAVGLDPVIIRKTAQHFKVRSEASARFEKHLDPMQNVIALQRFMYLALEQGLIDKVSENIVSVGKVIKPLACNISHAFIEKKLGIAIESKKIISILKSLDFACVSKKQKSDVVYEVTVPTFRITKDIDIQEDIVEEIVRMYGFENIAYVLPTRTMAPFSTHAVRTESYIKRYCAFFCRMHEVRDYVFYDESFLKRLDFNPEKAAIVKNPVSENWTRLVTSLVPHLLKNVELNSTKKDHIRFFEWNHIWPTIDQEQTSLAGIIFDKAELDFYACKQALQGLWDLLNISVIWQKAKTVAPWYDQYKTAELLVDGKSIGFAGMASESFVRSILTGQAFIFELHADFLVQHQIEHKKFKAWSKYQDVYYDISLLVPLSVTADSLKNDILKADEHIISVDLIDFFEKGEWKDQRSLTLRYYISHMQKTLEKKELEAIVHAVERVVKKHGAEIR